MPFDSFNTKDIDGVDDGINANLFRLMDEKKGATGEVSVSTDASASTDGSASASVSDDGSASASASHAGASASHAGASASTDEELNWDLFVAHYLGR
jgi:hypothetical protein